MKGKIKIFLWLLAIVVSVFTGGQFLSDQDSSGQNQVTEQAASEVESDVTEDLQTEPDVTEELQTVPDIVEEPEVIEEAGVYEEAETCAESEQETESLLDEEGSYTSKEEVAAYLHQYGKLPPNFITKKEAQSLGWVNTEGNLGEVAPGKSIGGDYFGNYEGLLPEDDDRDYYECDINTDGGHRGAERIVFSNDGLIYYTGDHYETFELLYGEE